MLVLVPVPVTVSASTSTPTPVGNVVACDCDCDSVAVGRALALPVSSAPLSASAAAVAGDRSGSERQRSGRACATCATCTISCARCNSFNSSHGHTGVSAAEALAAGAATPGCADAGARVGSAGVAGGDAGRGRGCRGRTGMDSLIFARAGHLLGRRPSHTRGVQGANAAMLRGMIESVWRGLRAQTGSRRAVSHCRWVLGEGAGPTARVLRHLASQSGAGRLVQARQGWRSILSLQRPCPCNPLPLPSHHVQHPSGSRGWGEREGVDSGGPGGVRAPSVRSYPLTHSHPHPSRDSSTAKPTPSRRDVLFLPHPHPKQTVYQQAFHFTAPFSRSRPSVLLHRRCADLRGHHFEMKLLKLRILEAMADRSFLRLEPHLIPRACLRVSLGPWTSSWT